MSYEKGKDIKQKGDCLTYYFIKKIEINSCNRRLHVDGYEIWSNNFECFKPVGFEKW